MFITNDIRYIGVNDHDVDLGHRHNGTGTITRKHVFCNVDGALVAGDGIDAV